MSYNVVSYWEEVAQRLKNRDQGKIIAGDFEPYYIYKRKLSLQILKSFNIEDQTILELGFGAGGNLIEFATMKPKKIYGADVSKTMYELAGKTTANIPNVELHLVENGVLPFANDFIDFAFTITVLQHNTNEESLKKTIAELCRVTKKRIIISERIESRLKGDDLCMGRPIKYYEEIFNKNGFKLIEVKHVKLQASFYVCGAIRKVFNPGSRKEGESLTRFSLLLQKVLLPVTSMLDQIIPSRRDLAYLVFEKEK